jgi:hypothetical protein
MHRLGIACVLATGCASESLPPIDPLARTDLREVLGLSAPDIVGITVEPDGDRVFVLDETAGLYAIDASGTATLVVGMDAMPDPGVEVRRPYTDLVALGGNRFALTAIGDGFLLDITANTQRLHFCYEPGFMPDDNSQRTDAVAFDAERGMLIAQPQTFNGQQTLIQSDLGFYDAASGEPLEFHPLDVNFLAGGMAAGAGDTVLLGRGDRLVHYDPVGRKIVHTDNLSPFGIGRVEGLALRTATSSLLVIDGHELVEIGLDQLD